MARPYLAHFHSIGTAPCGTPVVGHLICVAHICAIQHSILCCSQQWIPPVQGDNMAMQQLVLPTQCRETILRLAHSIPMAGHLGKQRQPVKSCNEFIDLLYSRMWGTTVGAVVNVRRLTWLGHHAPLILMLNVEDPLHCIATDLVRRLPHKLYSWLVCFPK